MSIVIAYAEKDFGIMASDGRVLENNIVIDENYQKYRRLNNSIILGYAGERNTGELISKIFSTTTSPHANIDQVYDDLVNKCTDVFSNKLLRRKCTVQFILCGKDKYGNYGCCCVSIVDNKVQAARSISYPQKMIACSGRVKDTLHIVEEYLSRGSGDIEHRIRSAIRRISRLDKSVNNHIFLEFV